MAKEVTFAIGQVFVFETNVGFGERYKPTIWHHQLLASLAQALVSLKTWILPFSRPSIFERVLRKPLEFTSNSDTLIEQYNEVKQIYEPTLDDVLKTL